MATTQGFPPWKDRIAEKDDCTTAAIRRAGGVIVGKTNVPELLHGMTSRNRLFGTTHNAYDLELSCLGSSGGSAVAVSASMVPLASGSDTGGSIRGPAAANGICGMRPSPGVVPHDDHIHAFNPTSIRGPMARTVADTQLFLAGMVSEGPDPYNHPVHPIDILNVRPGDLGSLRVAVSADLGFVDVHPEMRATFEAKIERLEGLFGSVTRCHPPLDEINRAYWTLRPMKFLPDLGEMHKRDPSSTTEYKRVDLRHAFASSVEDIAWAQAEQTRVFAQLRDFFQEYDLLIVPGHQNPLPSIAEIDAREQAMAEENERFGYDEYDFSADEGRAAINGSFTLTGSPVLTVTAGRDPAGLPFGINLIGAYKSDLRLLSSGLALEERTADDVELERPVPDLAALKDDTH
jgi:amidase